MKIASIGFVQFGGLALRRLLPHTDAQLVGVITRSTSNFNADFQALTAIAESAGVPAFQSSSNEQQAMTAQLRLWNPEIIHCFGWSYILNKTVLEIAPKGVIGFHPAALPQNRGRHLIYLGTGTKLNENSVQFFCNE